MSKSAKKRASDTTTPAGTAIPAVEIESLVTHASPRVPQGVIANK